MMPESMQEEEESLLMPPSAGNGQDEGLQINIRVAHAGDLNFIAATFKKSYAKAAGSRLRRRYHTEMNRRLAGMADVIVACVVEHPETILGWAAGSKEEGLLHYCYVRRSWDGLGIREKLLGALGKPAIATMENSCNLKVLEEYWAEPKEKEDGTDKH